MAQAEMQTQTALQAVIQKIMQTSARSKARSKAQAQAKTAAGLEALIPDIVEGFFAGSEFYEFGDGCEQCNYYQYAENGWCIDVEFMLEGDFCDSGDGYWTPRERFMESGRGYVDAVKGRREDEWTGECRDLTPEELMTVKLAIEDAIKRLG